MNIYPSMLGIHKILSQNPSLSKSLIDAFESSINLNPSVTNMKFRQLFEKHNLLYHKQGYSPKEIYYRIINDDWGHHYCKMCNNEIHNFRTMGNTFPKWCGAKCAGNDPDTLAIRKNTCMKLFGSENLYSSKYGKDKIKSKCIETYGVERYQLTKDFSNQIKISGKKRDLETRLKITKKREETNIKLFGAAYYTQTVAYIDNQVTNSNKVYTFPSGNTVNVQGYEPRALDLLLESGYKEEELLLRNRPSIPYFWPADDGIGDDKWHIYHPDIVIPHEKRIIEVKSTWTYSGKEEWVSKNAAKHKGSIDAGYSHEFWILG